MVFGLSQEQELLAIVIKSETERTLGYLIVWH